MCVHLCLRTRAGRMCCVCVILTLPCACGHLPCLCVLLCVLLCVHLQPYISCCPPHGPSCPACVGWVAHVTCQLTARAKQQQTVTHPPCPRCRVGVGPAHHVQPALQARRRAGGPHRGHHPHRQQGGQSKWTLYYCSEKLQVNWLRVSPACTLLLASGVPVRPLRAACARQGSALPDSIDSGSRAPCSRASRGADAALGDKRAASCTPRRQGTGTSGQPAAR